MYEPKSDLLKKYADILVKFALNSGKGIQKGDVVQCIVPDVAKPLLLALQQSILEAGGHPILRMLPTGLDKSFFELASEAQLTFFPKHYLRARVDLIDHSIGILADHDLHELKHVDPKKMMKAAESKNQVREWVDAKENAGKFTWTLALYGTPAMAKEASMSLRSYWQQIIRACFLNDDNPIEQWRKIFKEQERVKKALNSLPVDKLHIVGEHIDLWIRLGEKRVWHGGSGRNIPSFEIFTSPDWRGTEGVVRFNQPLYRYGNLVENVRLEFKAGRVIKASASKGNSVLQAIVKRKNADKIGEYSLTDKRSSRITKFMANTLYDENIGGPYGNTHLALGKSYHDTYDGDPGTVSKAEWKRLGFNDSGEHTDIISTEDRTVTATLTDGTEKVIYADGTFLV